MPFLPDKNSRITSTGEYGLVYKSGTKLVGRYLLLFHAPLMQEAAKGAEGAEGGERDEVAAGAEAGARVGITVSSKVGGAVVRNRVKRRIREAIRICLADGQPWARLVFVATRKAAGADFDGLVEDVGRLLSRMNK